MSEIQIRQIFKKDSLHVLLIICFFAVILYFFLGSPIVAGDTDLWYHLNGGKYFEDNKSIPWGSYFSFIEPARKWANYFWLFQVIVYKIYSFSGYYGLIILRAVVFSLLCFIILSYLLKGLNSGEQRLYFLVIFSFCCMVLVMRNVLVRPHIFTYMFIMLFLYILEYKPSRAWCLPFLSVLWVNIHGIEYPVMLLIVCSYLAEFLFSRISVKTPLKKEQLVYLLSLALCLGAVYATPHGVKLLSVPLVTTEYASLYINELRPLKIEEITSFEITNLIDLSYFTFFNLLMMASIVGLIRMFLSRKVRISHLILFAGGCFLITKMARFVSETLLLIIPLLKYSPAIRLGDSPGIKKRFNFIVILFLIILPIVHLRNLFPIQASYPLMKSNLPEGVVTFLKHVNVGGLVLNHPNKGGYHQWMLYPKYKIYMDMEVPFLFHDEDIYYANMSFLNSSLLDRMLRTYSPSFILAPNGVGGMLRELIKKHPEYVLVFFDDVEHLYIDRNQHPSLAQQYELKSLHPGSLEGLDIAAIKKTERDLIAEELTRMLNIYSDSPLHLQVMALIHNINGEFEKGADYSERMIRSAPEKSRGYSLRGAASMGMKHYAEAIGFFEKAIDRSGQSEKNELYKKISNCYVKLEKYQEAYVALRKALNIFGYGTSVNDLFMLGVLAMEVKKNEEALMLLKFAYLRTPEEDREMREKIWEKLSLFDLKEDALRDSLLYRKQKTR